MKRRWLAGLSCALCALVTLAACAASTKPLSNNEAVAAVDVKQERGTQDADLLIASIQKKDIPTLKRLLASGANPNAKDSGNYTPLMVAALRGEKEMAELLLLAGANINETDELGNTSLVKAIEFGETGVVELLVEKGANMEITGHSPFGDTALHVASRHNAGKEIIKILLSRSININIRNAEGNTPLMVAAASNLDAVRALVDRGADVNAVNQRGATALMASIGSVETMNILIEHGANVNARDADGWTALEIALLQGCPEIISLLEKAGAQE